MHALVLIAVLAAVPTELAGIVVPDGAGGFSVFPTGWLSRAGALNDDTESLQWACDNADVGARVLIRSVNNGVNRNPVYAANAPTPIALGKVGTVDMTWVTPRGSFGFFSEYRRFLPPFNDPVDIAKPITLAGESPLFERARDVAGDPLRAGSTLSGVRMALHVEANGVTIRDLRFEGFGNTITTARAGLTIEGCAFLRCFSPLAFFQDDYWAFPEYPTSFATRPDLKSTIRNNRIAPCRFGPYLYASEVSFTDNYVFTTASVLPAQTPDSLFGVILGGLDGPVMVSGLSDRFSRRECRNNEIARNTFDTDGTTLFGVLFSGHGSRTEGNRVVDNEILNTLIDGVHVDTGSWVEVSPFDPTITAPTLINAIDNLFSGNRLDGCGWDSMFIGWEPGYAFGNRFEDNTITGMGRGLDYAELSSGVSLIGAGGGTIRGNTIFGLGDADTDPMRIPGVGIALEECTGVMIDGNQFGDPATGEGLATRLSAVALKAGSSGSLVANNDYSASGIPGWDAGMGCVLLAEGTSQNLVVEPASFPDGTTVCDQVLDLAGANHVAGTASCARPRGRSSAAGAGALDKRGIMRANRGSMSGGGDE
jgi:hypothetical protein